MPRLIRRTRIISIRLSDAEYDQLQRLCTAKGVDSISELARNAMKLLILQETGNGNVPIESRVNALDREVARLSTLIGVARIAENGQ